MRGYSIHQGIKIANNFVPETFGRLTTLGPVFVVRGRTRRYYRQVCQCACGSIDPHYRNNLKAGNVKSCGCLHADIVKKHGGRGTPEYFAYNNMIQRCYNPNNTQYKDYGGRGIGVFSEWRGRGGFELWFAEIGPRPDNTYSINRIKNNGNYEPGNIHWATKEEQVNNTRANVLLTMGDKTQNVTQWAEEVGIDRSVITDRLRLGWDAERALTTPVKKRPKKTQEPKI